jgi:Lrp/AsnC family transcriptional regulator, leucine-responsive regulatory protein
MVILFHQLDKADKAILKVLQNQGRISNQDLAKLVYLSPAATHTRLKRLESQGYIDKYVAVLDRHKLGKDTLCYVQMSLSLHQHEQIQGLLKRIVDYPQVLECNHVTGEYDYLLKVIVTNTQELEQFISQKLVPIPGVAKIHTSIALKQYKNSTEISI